MENYGLIFLEAEKARRARPPQYFSLLNRSKLFTNSLLFKLLCSTHSLLELVPNKEIPRKVTIFRDTFLNVTILFRKHFLCPSQRLEASRGVYFSSSSSNSSSVIQLPFVKIKETCTLMKKL